MSKADLQEMLYAYLRTTNTKTGRKIRKYERYVYEVVYGGFQVRQTIW